MITSMHLITLTEAREADTATVPIFPNWWSVDRPDIMLENYITRCGTGIYTLTYRYQSQRHPLGGNRIAYMTLSQVEEDHHTLYHSTWMPILEELATPEGRDEILTALPDILMALIL